MKAFTFDPVWEAETSHLTDEQRRHVIEHLRQMIHQLQQRRRADRLPMPHLPPDRRAGN